jgi:hypothetical protein
MILGLFALATKHVGRHHFGSSSRRKLGSVHMQCRQGLASSGGYLDSHSTARKTRKGCLARTASTALEAREKHGGGGARKEVWICGWLGDTVDKYLASYKNTIYGADRPCISDLDFTLGSVRFGSRGSLYGSMEQSVEMYCTVPQRALI